MNRPITPADLCKVEEIKTHLQKHYKTDYHLKDLAKECNTTQTFIKTTFKSVVQLTFNEFQREYKLELARQLFQQGASVKAVSLEIGYTSDHLCTIYRKKFGHTPTGAGPETSSNTSSET
jgi:AraC-like DNA-binding protein